jgi:site-specific DNA-methyltransferase (cytosine-N4-specific)
MKAYIQPFERELALRELTQAAQTHPIALPDLLPEPCLYQVITSVSPNRLIKSLAYWESIANGRIDLTIQVQREATVNVVRNGLTPAQLAECLPFSANVPLPNRRSLRYGPHGLHEYRGKFFPQLARSLMNIAGLRSRSLVLDPMSGSGTTAVEAILSGFRARGLDMNPLSVFMGRTKCEILGVQPGELAAEYTTLREELDKKPRSLVRRRQWLNSLPKRDAIYLQGWFASEVLDTLDGLMQKIQTCNSKPIQNFFLLVLSNILRGVSWQKSADLRVRKEAKPASEFDPVTDFLAELERSVKVVLAFLYNEGPIKKSDLKILEGDARRVREFFVHEAGKIDAVITSPPYATALPYLDTDRLSLCYLGLLSRTNHRDRDQMMIGNREVTEAQRRQQWEMYQRCKTELPGDIQAIIESIDWLNREAEVGFRRRNLPALLAKYFLDMRDVLREIKAMLRVGASAFVVIGKNHTIAGGQRVDIETDRLLGQMGESVGLRLSESLPMDMLVSRDIFKKNAGIAETILFFKRPK